MVEPRLTVPIYVSGSHVRLTDAHAASLFDAPLTPLSPFGMSDLRPCVQTLRVRVGEVTFEDLRVVIGPVEQTEVRLHRPRYERVDASDAVHLDGPRGTVVLATPPRLVARRLTLSERDARTLGDEPHFTVHVAADRARVFTEVPAEPSGVSALWVEAEDLNSLDLSPDARALVL